MLFQHFLEYRDILGIFDVRRELIPGIGPRVAKAISKTFHFWPWD